MYDFFELFLLLGWIPIIAIKYLICGIIDAIKDNKCKHDLIYEESQINDYITGKASNISVSVTCKKCGYHKTYSKYKCD